MPKSQSPDEDLPAFMRLRAVLRSRTCRVLRHATLLLALPGSTSLAQHQQHMTAQLAQIGRAIFNDTRLSADGRISCASCHQPDKAFADGRVVAVGVDGRSGTRNTPDLRDVARRPVFFWDGRASRLEDAVLRPFFNPREHGLGSSADLIHRVRQPGSHAEALAAYHGLSSESIEASHIATALVAYLLELRPGESAFDRFRRGDAGALAEDARRGLDIFTGRAQCAGCHRITGEPARFTDDAQHSAGVGMPAIRGRLADSVLRAAQLRPEQTEAQLAADPVLAALGHFLISGDPADIGKFRTPALRNVASTAPYMHDGSVPTLEAVLEQELYYRSLVSGEPIVLTPGEREDLLAFLRSLTETH